MGFRDLFRKKPIEPEPPPEVEPEEPSQEQRQRELAEEQALRWTSNPRIAQTEEENIAKLFEVDSRMAIDKKLQKIKEEDTGIERDIGIESADEYPEPFNADMTKADMKDGEIKSCWGNLTIINTLRAMGKARKFDLIKTAQFNNAQKDSMINLSRGRGGFSVNASRTHRSVAEGVLNRDKAERKEREGKRWGIL